MKNAEKRNAQTRTEMQTSEWAVVHNHEKVSDYVFITDGAPKGECRGTWTTKDQYVFTKNDYNFNGSTGDNCEQNFKNAYNGHMKNCAMISFLHSGNENNQNNKTYQVTLTLKSMRNAWAENDQGLNTQRGWFLDHIGGYPTGEASAHTQSLDEYPSRSNHYISESETNEYSVNYQYEPQICEPGRAVGFATRGFEVDDQRLNTDRFEIDFKDWAKLMWEFGNALLTRKYTDFAIETATMLIKAALGNEDDPMTPVISAFSHEACQFIYENCPNKTFKFTRRAVGMDTYLSEITVFDSDEVNWSKGDYVQYLNAYETRHYELEYEVRVDVLEELSDWYKIKEKNTGLFWEVSNNRGDQVRSTSTQNNSNNQLFKFEKQSDGRYYILSKASNRYLGPYGAGPDYTALAVYDANPNPSVRFSLTKLSSGGYVLRGTNETDGFHARPSEGGKVLEWIGIGGSPVELEFIP